MPIRYSKRLMNELLDELQAYETIHGIQDVDSLRRITRGFAEARSPGNPKAAQQMYHAVFMTVCFRRNLDIPADYNQENQYDPDSIYPNDAGIRRKLRRQELKMKEILMNMGVPIEEIDT